MGSPVSPIVANLYMENFETEALDTVRNPPSLWFGYVDDTMTQLHEYHVEEFSTHLNSINEHIKFTSESEEDGKIPFLDTCLHIKDDGSTKVTVYRKPTHTDQFLNFSSNHHLDHKRSVVRTLFHRADKIVTEEKDKKAEKDHVTDALRANGYPEWMFKIPSKQIKKDSTSHQHTDKRRPNVGIPYVPGTSETLHRIFRKHGVNMYHCPFNSIWSQVMHVKDKTDKMKKCGVVYYVKCEQCKNDYVGETGEGLYFSS